MNVVRRSAVVGCAHGPQEPLLHQQQQQEVKQQLKRRMSSPCCCHHPTHLQQLSHRLQCLQRPSTPRKKSGVLQSRMGPQLCGQLQKK